MAQAVRRLGGEVTLVEGAGHVLAREPAPLGHALGEVLRADGIELILGVTATAARRDGPDYVLTLEGGRELRGDHLLAATGRRQRLPAGLDTVGVTAGPHGIAVDAHLQAGERLWAIGDVTGVRLLTHVGKYQGEGRHRHEPRPLRDPRPERRERLRRAVPRPGGIVTGRRHRPPGGIMTTAPGVRRPAPTGTARAECRRDRRQLRNHDRAHSQRAAGGP